jgi:hypothetical protein
MVRRQVNPFVQQTLEIRKPPVQAQRNELQFLRRIDPHDVFLVEEHQPVVESPVECRRERESIPNIVGTSFRANGQNVRGIHEAQLKPTHGAAVSVGSQDLLPKTGCP